MPIPLGAGLYRLWRDVGDAGIARFGHGLRRSSEVLELRIAYQLRSRKLRKYRTYNQRLTLNLKIYSHKIHRGETLPLCSTL